uniref:NADH dehydrogenase subunit 4 n=1 Tax=Argas ricei TaxID=2944766 RepID=UPI0022372C86|nr:NADH dehydrogenase subunit 4 [Argas ricei]UYB77984.1 NADH dehydrogenase subunit 4 [Argas sp. San Antonio ARK-2022a]UYB77997.1 NADH dehydrogenase subunit 4 [Argas ricei]
MLKILFLFFLMMCVCMYLNMVEIFIFMTVGMFLLLFIVDWESMWMSYILGGFSLDEMSLSLIMLSFWIGILMVLASFNSSIVFSKSFYFYLMMMMMMLIFCFSFVNFMFFFIAFEGVLFPIIMIIFGWGYQPERLQAGIYMLFYTLFGSLPLLMYLLLSNCSLNFIYLFKEINEKWGIMFFFIVFAFLVKVPMYMLHLWLPKAHVEAPISGSMILAGVLLKLGIYGLYRFKILILNLVSLYSSVFMSISLVGGVIISLVCLSQVDLKSLIAYSSVCHMGLALGGFFSMNIWGGNGALLMMIGHGLCSSALFCLANFMYERFFTRSLMLLSGLGLIFPFLSFWWFLFCVVNMAAPPSMNFLSEIILMGSMLSYSFFLMILLFFLSFFSACYSLYMYSYTQHGKGWVVYGVKVVNEREYLLMFLHFFPLVIWFLKMEFFTNWF